MRSTFLSVFVAFFAGVQSFNFPWESIQLTEQDISNFSAISFGDTTKFDPSLSTPACKAFPGSPDWPLDEEWNRLNVSLGGALLKPSPPGVVCYPGPLYDAGKCTYLLTGAFKSRFYINDPLTVLTSWTEGNTCPATMAPGNSTCTQGGFAVHVVNATTVRDVQIAVNFARNKNLRLVIKNTGHDFSGRSTGAGALSIWTHNLKTFEFLPEYTQGEYNGRAARVSAGLEAWEMYAYMDTYNMTLVVPGGYTVGPYGGWMAGGGHSTIGSVHGLGSDQPLSLQVVTADGRFLTAGPETNSDLFYALRGGGPSTYGIVTSAVVKAYPPIYVSEASLDFNGGFVPAFNFSSIGNFTANFTLPFPLPPAPASTLNLTVFWKAVTLYHNYTKTIVDNGGTAYSYISKTSNNSYSFTTSIEMPGMNNSEAYTFLQPLYNSTRALGIHVNQSLPVTSLSWGSSRQGEGDSPGDSRFASRLFPYSNWEDATKFNTTMAAIRSVVEAGYTFHGISIKPDEATAGYPGNSAVNPAFRRAIMHADIFDHFSITPNSATSRKASEQSLNASMAAIREATPDGGSYINESDVEEPDWQRSFFGDKYEALLAIKRQRDPWELFYAVKTVGTEGWEVRTSDGLPTQNGRLCRVGA